MSVRAPWPWRREVWRSDEFNWRRLWWRWFRWLRRTEESSPPEKRKHPPNEGHWND